MNENLREALITGLLLLASAFLIGGVVTMVANEKQVFSDDSGK